MKNKMRQIGKIGLVFACVLILIVVCKGAFTANLGKDFNDAEGEILRYTVAEEEIRQYFTTDNQVTCINLCMDKQAEPDTTTICLRLYDADTQDLLKEVLVELTGTCENQRVSFVFDAPVGDVDGENRFFFTVSDTEHSQAAAIVMSENQYEEALFIDGQPVAARCKFYVGYGTKVLWGNLLLAALFAGVVCGFIVFGLLGNKKYKLTAEKNFLILALAGGIAMAVINPAVQVCDGWDHYLRSVDVSYGNILAPLVTLNHEDGVLELPANYGAFQYRVIDANSGVGNDYNENLKQLHYTEETILLPYESSFISLFYYPQAIGLFIGRVLGLSVYWQIIIARILNFLAYCGLTYLAIKKAPLLKNVFLLLGLMPITICQAASCSPDAILTGSCFLFTALCFSYAYEEERELNVKDTLFLGVLLSIIFVCKYIYVCLGLLVFLIPKKRFANKKTYWKAFFIALIPLAIAVLVIVKPVLFSTVSQAQAAAGDYTQMQFIMDNPLAFAKVFIKSILNNTNAYMGWLSTIGSMNYPLGPLLSVMPCIIACVGVLDTNDCVKRIKVSHRMLCAAAFMLSTFAMFLGLYVGDGRINPVGSSIVLGVQGRYFIPILVPAFAVLLSNKLENKIQQFSEKVAGLSGVILLYALIMVARYCY